MKKTIVLLLLCITTMGIAQKKVKSKSKVNNKMEKFDIEEYKKNETPLGNYYYKNKNGVIVEQMGGIGGYAEYKYVDYFFRVYKEFYPNGVIKEKGEIIGDFPKGVWYSFNERGELTEEVDYDKPYKFTWDDMQAYCKNNNIAFDKHTKIERGNDDKFGLHWSLRYTGKYEEYKGIIQIYMDGTTGEKLKVEYWSRRAMEPEDNGVVYKLLYEKKKESTESKETKKQGAYLSNDNDDTPNSNLIFILLIVGMLAIAATIFYFRYEEGEKVRRVEYLNH